MQAGALVSHPRQHAYVPLPQLTEQEPAVEEQAQDVAPRPPDSQEARPPPPSIQSEPVPTQDDLLKSVRRLADGCLVQREDDDGFVWPVVERRAIGFERRLHFQHPQEDGILRKRLVGGNAKNLYAGAARRR